MLWRARFILCLCAAFPWPSRAADVEPTVLVEERQLLYVLGAFALAVLVTGFWVLFLRRRVREKIEEIRKHEALLEERFRDLYENANDIIYTHDLEGRITSMSNAGLAAFGYSGPEVVGMSIAQILDPEDLENARRRTKEKLHGTLRTTYELRLRARDGRRLYFDVNSRLIFKDGVPVGVQGIARDVTERRNAEEALRISERQLRASLEERERLGRDLHDGIIQSIYAAGLNLEDTVHLVRGDPEAAENRIRKLTADLNRIIREVRGFIMGLERPHLKGDEFKAALQTLSMIVSDNKAAQVDLHIDDHAAVELSAIEATQLLQIAREALSNSIRHAKARKFIFKLGKSAEGVTFEMCDDGIGFNPADNAEKGLGLRNMAARAEEINARFQIVSQRGQGARIVLDMPRPTAQKMGA